MTRVGASIAVLVFGAALSGSGCAYYNAMWSAERFAKDARRQEQRGQVAEARSSWARAAVKAESVVARHPKSRWADDALVLQAEGLSRAGSCAAAAAPILKAQETVRDPALRERVGLAAALCALSGGQPSRADAALSGALTSEDASRRSRAEYLAGEAAAMRLDYGGAVEHYRRSRVPAALPARARALLAAGRLVEAAAVVDTAGSLSLPETERAALLAELGAAAGADAASQVLDEHLRAARLPFAEQARLLIADGDRQLAEYDAAAALVRYRQAFETASPGTAEAGIARVREQRALVARATEPEHLTGVIAELTRLTREGAGGGPGAQRLLDLVSDALAAGSTPGTRFRSIELARDSLGAPALAGRLFLDLAARDPASLYAPKALVAALPLLPERRDSIVGVLDTRYGDSPYTRAFHGEASVAYAAAEDSLARELGLEVARVAPASEARVQSPRIGPRGPLLDEFPGSAPATDARPVRPPRADERATPVRDRPGQPDRP